MSIDPARHPRVSVVIPCYRDAATLGRALTSLQMQTRQADEVIVVDDCSPESDLIRRVLEDFPQTVYLRNPANLGLAGTRNRGLHAASGNIIAFLDADDEAHPQRIEWQLQLVDDNTAVACDVERIPAGATAVPQHYPWPPHVTTYRSTATMIYANRLTGASLMAPAGLLRRAAGYDASLRSCEDFDLWLRLLTAGCCVKRIDRPLYFYHQNPAGLSRRYHDIARWELAVVDKFTASAGATASLRTGTIWAVWLLRHFARAAVLADTALHEQATRELVRLEKWPVLRRLVKIVAASGVLKLWHRTFKART